MQRKERKDKRVEPRGVRESEYRMFVNGKLNTRHPEKFNWLLGFSDKPRGAAPKYFPNVEQLKNNDYATTEKYLHS